MSRALDFIERALKALHAGADCEVFIRRTERLCIARERGRTRVRRGLEEGTAVRLRRADGALGFGAASGAGPGAAARAGSLARALPPSAPTHGPAWSESGDLRDLDGPSQLPPVEEARAWLCAAEARARVALDAAVGLEVLGTGGGLRAVRLRGLVWGRLWDGNGVRSAVARRLERLDPGDWQEPPAAQAPSSFRDGYSPHTPLVLMPAAAGALVPALVATVPPGAPAGAGWVCEDDPADPDAPGGGRFDDTGFLAERLTLADGRHVLASPEGPGRRRRLSFREPPVERAAQIRFLPAGSWRGDGLLVRAARVHVVDGRWFTLLEAAPIHRDGPALPWRHWVVHARPETWVASCSASLGPVRRTPEGVASGLLVFNGPCAVPVD